MNIYATGTIIKKLREEMNITQQQLAEKLSVSDKAVSKWETGRGYPDITLLEPLSAALGISVIELLSGDDVTNKNKSFNMNRIKFYVCPICGNIIISTGESIVSCCGITLPPLETEDSDGLHCIETETVEDEFFLSVPHEMTKNHYISFIAAVRDNGCEFVKLYPEGNAEARFKLGGVRCIYYYCNRHGLFRISRKDLRKKAE